MKKILFLLVILTVGLSLAGCNVNSTTDDADTSSTEQSDTDNIPTPPVPAAPTE